MKNIFQQLEVTVSVRTKTLRNGGDLNTELKNPKAANHLKILSSCFILFKRAPKFSYLQNSLF